MLENDVLKIFWDNKDRIIPSNLSVSSNPKAILLGGQGAVGKSYLVDIIKEDNEECVFLSINGDDFRIFHPDFHALVDDDVKFPRETQVFSNVFTKNLIDIGAENKLNMIVEGTMRNPSVPISTAENLKNKGYSVEAYIIAAPKEFSSIIGYSRYVKDRRNQGFGRMLDMKSHNQAANGLPKSIDELSERGLVEQIKIYDMFARKLCATLKKDHDNQWTPQTKPSDLIYQIRASQLSDINFIDSILQTGKNAVPFVNAGLRNDLENRISKLETLRSNIMFVDNKQISNIHVLNLNGKFYLNACLGNKPLPTLEIDETLFTAHKKKLISDTLIIATVYSDLLRNISRHKGNSYKI